MIQTVLWIIGTAFAIVLAGATWFTADTIRLIRKASHVQTRINKDRR